MNRVFVVGLVLLAVASMAQELSRPAAIGVEPGGSWQRRDWHRCKSPAKLLVDDDRMIIQSDTAAVLYWQVPTLEETGMVFAEKNKWRRRCTMPGWRFWRSIKGRKSEDGLVPLAHYPLMAWDWHIDERGPQLKLEQPDKGYVVRLGVSVATADRKKVRELIYQWTHNPPRQPQGYIKKRTIVPGLFHLKSARLAVQSGSGKLGQWMEYERDLYADFKHFYPKDEPGNVVSIYVKVPTRTGREQAAVSLRDWQFRRRPGASAP
ncbi:MAG: DUF3047 domain-containing protein [Candidatus Latescibacteria bacterium]|nr:DUF3047 domain-containing protein [Candidatus Latescibacterota bacterium]